MADIAIAFNWSLGELSAMGIVELAEWRERARVRMEPPKQ